MLGGKDMGRRVGCSPVTSIRFPSPSRSLLAGRRGGPLHRVWTRGRAGREETLPTCMVTLAVSTGTQCRASSPQQPAQRSKGTQGGLNMYATSSGYSDKMFTSSSFAWQ